LRLWDFNLLNDLRLVILLKARDKCKRFDRLDVKDSGYILLI